MSPVGDAGGTIGPNAAVPGSTRDTSGRRNEDNVGASMSVEGSDKDDKAAALEAKARALDLLGFYIESIAKDGSK